MPTFPDNAVNFQVDPDWADIWFGAVHPMGMEFPRFHEALRMIDDRGGVGPAWFFQGMPLRPDPARGRASSLS
jgi:hypothetical protein